MVVLIAYSTHMFLLWQWTTTLLMYINVETMVIVTCSDMVATSHGTDLLFPIRSTLPYLPAIWKYTAMAFLLFQCRLGRDLAADYLPSQTLGRVSP